MIWKKGYVPFIKPVDAYIFIGQHKHEDVPNFLPPLKPWPYSPPYDHLLDPIRLFGGLITSMNCCHIADAERFQRGVIPSSSGGHYISSPALTKASWQSVMGKSVERLAAQGGLYLKQLGAALHPSKALNSLSRTPRTDVGML